MSLVNLIKFLEDLQEGVCVSTRESQAKSTAQFSLAGLRSWHYNPIVMTNYQAYQEALDYLYSYIDYSLTRSDRYSPDRFNLDRMYALMEALGNPQNEYAIIHVAGTKGKGSVCAFCASGLQAAGYRVGLYTSPHGHEFTERIQVNREEIPQEAIVALVEEMKPVVESIPELTTFEIGTALALLFFAREGVDVTILEVGLGGRLDATNVVSPLVSVITSISYDHTQFLGDTLLKIAAEKSGIIKPDTPVVIAPQHDEALLSIERSAGEQNAPLVRVGRDYLYAPIAHSLDRQTLLFWSSEEQALADAYIESGGDNQDWEPQRIHIPLLGAHQVVNAATAYAALLTARGRGLDFRVAEVVRGFGTVTWPARFELLNRTPPIVIDSAHNRDSALKLRLAMDDYFPGLPVIMVFGASEDKDITGMFAEILPRVRRVIATKSIHPRAIDPETLVDLAHQFGKPAQAHETVEEALEEAIRAAEREAVILVCGSLFVAAGARVAWNSRMVAGAGSNNGED